jgi:RES domain-containing protein
MYVVADSFESGEPIVQLIQWHWSVFEEDTLGENMQARLLEKIVNSDWDDDSGEDKLNARELYSPLGNTFHTTHRERWEQFCSDVRDNPGEPLPFEDFYAEEFALLEAVLPIETKFYRARRGFEPGDYGEQTPFEGDGLGAPREDKALAGRANTKGQRVLYCADQEKTAIAETRPPLGFYVSIGTLKLNREARLLDLTMEPHELNPFATESLGWHVQIRSLLNAFAEEMSRPLERDDDTTHYIPCQRLAEFIKDAGYDGIRYPSAISPGGTNVVLFDQNIAEVTDARLAHITELALNYDFEPSPSEEPLAVKVDLGEATAADKLDHESDDKAS